MIRDNDLRLLEFALRHTAVTVAERCRELRCGSEASFGTAELLEKTLDKARDDEQLNVPDLVDQVPLGYASWSVRQADAFLNLVNEFLLGRTSEGCANDNYLVTVHVDQTALAGGDGRSALPIEAVKRLCCDSHAVVITENDDGQPLSIGRKTRIIPTAIQRALRARDNSCCAPGTTHWCTRVAFESAKTF